jgi:metal-sulfur cluster biosynthetic enzyme
VEAIMISKTDIEEALKGVIDPELGINIVDLGLVYDIAISEREVVVTMTMTSAACPLHNLITQMVDRAVFDVTAGKAEVTVNLVFDPPWTPERMSAEARRVLG